MKTTRTTLYYVAAIALTTVVLLVLLRADGRRQAQLKPATKRPSRYFAIDRRRPLVDEVRRFLDRYNLTARTIVLGVDYLDIPADLHSGRVPDGTPWRSLYRASRRSGLDFRRLSGRRVELMEADLGVEPNRGARVTADMLRWDEFIVGAWLHAAGPPPTRALPLTTLRSRVVPAYSSPGPKDRKVGVALAAIQDVYLSRVVPEFGRQDYLVVNAVRCLKLPQRRKLRLWLRKLGVTVVMGSGAKPPSIPALSTTHEVAAVALSRMKVKGKRARVRMDVRKGDAAGMSLAYRLVRRGSHWRVTRARELSQ